MNGHAIVCDRSTEVTAIVTAMNPAINASTDCDELAGLQQALLWVLYDFGFLDKCGTLSLPDATLIECTAFMLLYRLLFV